MARIAKLVAETYISHTNCPKAEEWRAKTSQPGFPTFTPECHERFDEASIYLKCDGCGTSIRHTTRARNVGVEST